MAINRVDIRGAAGAGADDAYARLREIIALQERRRQAMEWHSCFEWARRIGVRTESGEVLHNRDMPWREQLWQETHGRIVMEKPTQIGATTFEYVWAMHRAAVRGNTVIYTMPTGSDVTDFIKGRLNKVIEFTPELAAMVGRGTRVRDKIDGSGMKSFGRGMIYFRGTFTERAAISVPAHARVHDEVDFSVAEVLEMYRRRLSALPASQHQELFASTPTVEGFGIDKLLQESDYKEWLVKCPSCGKWENGSLDYWTHTDGVLLFLQCRFCKQKLDPRHGAWVARYPERSKNILRSRGYKIVRMMAVLPDARGEELLTDLHTARANAQFQRHFYNMDLGVTSSEGTTAPTMEGVLAACYSGFPHYGMTQIPVAETGTGPYYAGVDVGSELNVWVARCDPYKDGKRMRLVYADRLSDPSRGSGAWGEIQQSGKPGLAGIMQRFGIRKLVIDGMPESALSHDFAQRFPGRVLVCYYRENQRAEVSASSDVIRRATGIEAGATDNAERFDVNVDRTESLDRTIGEILGGGWMFPGEPPVLHREVEESIMHLTNLLRKPEDQKRNGLIVGTVYRWSHRGPDHYAHAANYCRIARDEDRRLSAINPPSTAPIGITGVNFAR